MKGFSERMGAARGLLVDLAFDLKHENPTLALECLVLGESIERAYFVSDATRTIRAICEESKAAHARMRAETPTSPEKP